MDGLIMTAAVADYKPKDYQSSKIKKDEINMSIELVKNTDILKTLSLNKKQHQFKNFACVAPGLVREIVRATNCGRLVDAAGIFVNPR